MDLSLCALSEKERVRGEGAYEVPVVGDEEDPAWEVLEGVEEYVLGLYVEMVGRLVEHQQVVVAEDELREEHLRALTGAELRCGLVDGLPAHAHPPHDRAHQGLVAAGGEDGSKGGVSPGQPAVVLIEVPDPGGRRDTRLARERGKLAEQ